MKIIQISDTHIRNLKYHDVYRIQFEKIYNELRDIKPDRITLLGDTLDNFVSITNEAKILAGEFLTNLSNIAPLIVTYGNHECMKSNTVRINSIETLIQLLNNKNITYLGETCFYEDDDVIWVNYAHLDKGDIDPWNDNNIIIPKSVKTKPTIGLFHDPIYGSTTDTNMKFESASLKHISFFDKCDYLMCGDIHKYQLLRDNGTSAYSSSTIQNSFGETPNMHGFIEWNIKSKTDFEHKFHDIKNDYNFINLSINKDYDYDNITLYNKYITPHSEIKVKWSDYVSSMTYENEIKIRKFIKNTFNIDKVKFDKDIIKTDMVDGESVNESINVLDPNQQRKIFNDFLKSNKFDDKFIEKVLNIDDIINNKIVRTESNGVSFIINEIIMNNFKSYGDDVRLNFDELGRNSLIRVGGINQQGKTTLLEAICFGLYGQTNNSKKMKFLDSKFINNKRDLDKTSVTIVITINEQKYTIIREINRKWNKTKTEISACPTTVNYFKGSIDDYEPLNDEQTKDTQKLIDQTIGTFDDFIRLSLTTADDLNALISQDRSVFIDNLIKDMGIDIYESKLNEFKEYKKNILSLRKNIDIDFTKSEIERIEKLITELSVDQDYLNNDRDSYEKDRKILFLESQNKTSNLDKIDIEIENLNITDIELSIETEENKINKNNDRLELLVKLKDDIENYDIKSLDNKQIEIDNLSELINSSKLMFANIENEIQKKESDIKQYTNESKVEKTKFINDLLSINKDYNLEISKIKENFGSIINIYTNDINIKLSKINNQQTIITNKIDSFITDGKKLKDENDEIEQSTVCITCKRTLDGVDMVHIHSKVDNNKTEIELLRSQILELRPKLKNLDDESIVLNDIINKIKNKDYTFDEEILDTYNIAKTNIKDFKDKIDKNIGIISDIENGKFPNELMEILNTFIEKIKTLEVEIDKLSLNKKEITLDINTNNITLISFKDELKLLKEEKENIDKKKEKLALEPRIESDIEKSKILIKEYKKQIDEYNSTLDKIESNKLINKEIKLLYDNIEKIDIDIKRIDENRIKLSNEIFNLNTNSINYNLDVKLHNGYKKEDEVLSVYMKSVHRDGIPSFLIKLSLADINIQLSKLLIDTDFTIFFDEDINLRLSSNTFLGISQSIIDSSGKERTFASIVLKFVLRSYNNSKPNILILDEIMGKLVENSITEFTDLLNVIKNEVDKLLIIEHIHNINSDYEIIVEKNEDGVSSLKIN